MEQEYLILDEKKHFLVLVGMIVFPYQKPLTSIKSRFEYPNHFQIEDNANSIQPNSC